MNYYIDGNFSIPNHIDSKENNFYSSSYSTKNTNYIPIFPPSSKQKEINNSSFDEVVDYYNKRESIFTEFENNTGINIWFFEHFRLYFNYRTFLAKKSCIEHFIELNPNGIIITTDVRLKKFIKDDNLELVLVSTKNESKSNYIHELRFLFKHYKRNPKQLNKELIISRIEDDIEGKDRRFGELQINSDKIINRDLFNTTKELPKQNSIYSSSNNVDTLFVRYLFSVKGFFFLFKFKKQLSWLFNQLNSFDSNKTMNNSIINEMFQKNKLSYFVYYLKYKSFKHFFKNKSYNSVLFINENSAQQKAIQYAAIQNNVKVFAIQHGAIYDLHPAYMYGKYKNVPVLPTITFTWGKYFSKLLIEKGGYTENQVVTSGRILPNLKRQMHNGLTTDKKILVYATQPQPDYNLRVTELLDVFIAAKTHINKYLLVIRPHPAEKEDSFFEGIANKIQFNQFIIDRESDLKTHFECCSLLITSYSTVGAEFVPYYKPLLILDYLKSDPVNYIKQNIGIPIYNKEALIDNLSKKSLSINKSAHKAFVDNYFYFEGQKAVEIIHSEMKA